MKATDHFPLTGCYKSCGKKLREKKRNQRRAKDPAQKHGLAFKLYQIVMIFRQ